MRIKEKPIHVLIIFTFFLSILGQAALPARAHPGRLQGELVHLALQTPDQMIPVIVQKEFQDVRVENLATTLGGSVTKELTIINAFAADLSGRAIFQLAQAEGVRWVSLDAQVEKTSGPDGEVNTTNLINIYNTAINADDLWAQGYQGSGITVAVVDSGISTQSFSDLKPRLLAFEKFNSNSNAMSDQFGHGTHIAGIIGSNGVSSNGSYIGVAPKVNLVSVKISNDQGNSTASDVVAGLQWVNDHRLDYNIRVVNLSINSTVSQSYHVDPIDAAVEILWFNGIVVVVSAGNNGPAKLSPPANDPFVITVGATDDEGTAGISDDAVASFSGYGTTMDGYAKPDLVAPGKNIISLLTSKGCELAKDHPGNIVENNNFKMSGTSMAAAVVSGAVALLLQDDPNMNPDQVKYRLMATANKTWSNYSSTTAGAGYLDVLAAVNGTTTETANTATHVSNLLTTGSDPVKSSVNWSSVNWSSVNWSSVNWSSVNWSSDYWGN
jgi:serine protease AprX